MLTLHNPSCQAVPEGFHSNRRKAAALVTDKDSGEPDYDIPEDSKAGVVEVTKDAAGNTLIDGKPADSGPEMGPQTGWEPRFGWPVESVMEGESLLDHQTWLEGKMPDKYYGGKSLQQVSASRQGSLCSLPLV